MGARAQPSFPGCLAEQLPCFQCLPHCVSREGVDDGCSQFVAFCSTVCAHLGYGCVLLASCKAKIQNLPMVGMGLGDGKVIFLIHRATVQTPTAIFYRKRIRVVINLHLRLYVQGMRMERAWF